MPTKLRVLRGESRPSQINRHEPEPLPGGPIAPDDLSPEAKAVWERVLREVGQTGVIRGADADVYRMYCEAVVRYRQAEGLLRQTGPLVVDRHHGGAAVRSPLHQIVRDNAVLVRALAGELGLTPAARVGLRDGGEGAPVASTLEQLRARHAARR
jgi:P27 family predicted phage terminase small subunit